MSHYRPPSSHIETDPLDKPELLTYTVGDIPEVAEALKRVMHDIESSKTEEVGWEIFEVPDEGTPRGLGRGDAKERNSDQARDLKLLFDLRDQFGNGSKVVEVNEFDREQKSKRARPEPYNAVVVYNPDGSELGVVTDTMTENNSAYVWRRDATDLPASEAWPKVFSTRKNHAKEYQAIDVRHGKSLEAFNNRVVDLLTMPADDFLNVATTPKGTPRPRLGQ